MEAKVNKGEFLKAIRLGKGVSGDNPFVMDMTEDGKLTLYFSDGDRGVWKDIQVECDKRWDDFICVPRDLVESWLSAFSDADLLISLSYTKTELRLSSPYGISRIRRKAYLLPQEPPKEGEYLFSLLPATLKSCHRYVIRSVGGKYEYGGVLQGVYIHWKDGKLRFAATNRIKLSSASVSLVQRKDSASSEGGFVIYGDHLSNLVELFDGSDFVDFYYDEERRRLIAKQGDLSLVNVLVQGKFPDYERLLQISRENVFCLGRDEVISIIESLSKFSDSIMKVRWDGGITFLSESEEMGDCELTSTLVWKSVRDETGMVGYNPGLFVSLVKACHGDNFVMEVAGNGPTLIRPEKNDDNLEVFHLISPLSLQ